MIVVSDSSPLVALAAIGQADLLLKLYQRVLIPDAVFREVIERGANKLGSETLREARWLERVSVTDRNLIAVLRESLDAGEAEAIALAVPVNAELLLIDERLGRRAAQALGVKVVGVVGVILEAKQGQWVNAIKPILDALNDRVGFHLSEALYRHALSLAGEAE